MRLKKNDCCQKIGAKQLKKMRLIKMTAAKKSEQNSVRLKNAPYENACGQKNRSKTVEKKGTFYKRPTKESAEQCMITKGAL